VHLGARIAAAAALLVAVVAGYLGLVLAFNQGRRWRNVVLLPLLAFRVVYALAMVGA
jgi:hypothetical protein